MADYKLLNSSQDKSQLQHQGFTLCQNKKPTGKNLTAYFRGVYVDKQTKQKCPATAATTGVLRVGKTKRI